MTAREHSANAVRPRQVRMGGMGRSVVHNMTREVATSHETRHGVTQQQQHLVSAHLGTSG